MTAIPLTGQIASVLRAVLAAAIFVVGGGLGWWGASAWSGRKVANAEKAAADSRADLGVARASLAEAQVRLAATEKAANKAAIAAAAAARSALLPVFERLRKEARDAKDRADAACRVDADWVRRYNEALVPGGGGHAARAAGRSASAAE